MDLLAIDGSISHCKVPIGSCNKIFNEHLDNVSISIAVTEAMIEDSSIGDDFEDETDSDLEIERLIKTQIQ